MASSTSMLLASPTSDAKLRLACRGSPAPSLPTSSRPVQFLTLKPLLPLPAASLTLSSELPLAPVSAEITRFTTDVACPSSP